MSRPFDHGRAAYAAEHRADSDQHTRHILADSLLGYYHAKPEKYAEWSDQNYRMGSVATNTRDSRLDSHIISEVFGAGKRGTAGYDAYELTQSTATAAGLSYQQQLAGISQRFGRAKEAYETTGEYKYFMMQKDLRDIASDHLDGDMRKFRLSKR